jgi:hypothetical protein
MFNYSIVHIFKINTLISPDFLHFSCIKSSSMKSPVTKAEFVYLPDYVPITDGRKAKFLGLN